MVRAELFEGWRADARTGAARDAYPTFPGGGAMAAAEHPKVPVAILDGTDMRPAGVEELDVQEVQAWLGIKGIPKAVIVIVPEERST